MSESTETSPEELWEADRQAWLQKKPQSSQETHRALSNESSMSESKPSHPLTPFQSLPQPQSHPPPQKQQKQHSPKFSFSALKDFASLRSYCGIAGGGSSPSSSTSSSSSMTASPTTSSFSFRSGSQQQQQQQMYDEIEKLLAMDHTTIKGKDKAKLQNVLQRMHDNHSLKKPLPLPLLLCSGEYYDPNDSSGLGYRMVQYRRNTQARL